MEPREAIPGLFYDANDNVVHIPTLADFLPEIVAYVARPHSEWYTCMQCGRAFQGGQHIYMMTLRVNDTKENFDLSHKEKSQTVFVCLSGDCAVDVVGLAVQNGLAFSAFTFEVPKP